MRTYSKFPGAAHFPNYFLDEMALFAEIILSFQKKGGMMEFSNKLILRHSFLKIYF